MSEAYEEQVVAELGGEPTEAEGELSNTVSIVSRQASAMEVVDQKTLENAVAFGREVKNRMATVKDYWKPLKDAANAAHKRLCERESEMLRPLTYAEAVLKGKIGAYSALVEQQRAEREAAARKAAQEEAERRMREAEALETKGDTEAANAALSDAMVMDTAARQIVVTPTPATAPGMSTRKDWEIVSIDESAIPREMQGVPLVVVDEAAILRLVRATKGTISIPGVAYREKTVTVLRR